MARTTIDIKTIGVLTSGGDAPGMNAAIRSVVRVAASRDCTVLGFQRGYAGLIAGECEELPPRAVSNIIQRGGTVLKTSRCEPFFEAEGRQLARRVLEERGVDALVVIGGDGSFRGAHELGGIWDGRIVGVPGTIDNDLYGTDATVGFDTAIGTALDAIDKIRDTASSHERVFLVEVMGRHSGYIALDVGTAGGAEEILVPEQDDDIEALCERLVAAREKGKLMSIIVVAEGEDEAGGFGIARQVKERTGFDPRVTVLGHVQRGGRPTARDRILATKLGAFAVDTVLAGETGVMVGEVRGELVRTPLPKCWKKKKPLDPYLLRLVPILAS